VSRDFISLDVCSVRCAKANQFIYCYVNNACTPEALSLCIDASGTVTPTSDVCNKVLQGGPY
jgi:hypothetical protein